MGRRVALAVGLALWLSVAGCSSGPSDAELEPPPLTLAVIGDTPYGDDQVARFPLLVDAVNANVDVDLVLHVGDIKTGGSTCTADRFRDLRGLLDSFRAPLVYTPGDNEWTDCGRARAGGYPPQGRLALLRRTFWKRPSRSLGGRPISLRSQSEQPGFEQFVENAIWTMKGIVLATVHVVGSNNGRDLPGGRAAFEARQAAALAWIDEAFEAAGGSETLGVVIALHADMFGSAIQSGHRQIAARLQQRAAAFDGPVLLLNGDSHRYRVDGPLSGAPNLTRIVVQGETAHEWLRVDVEPDDPQLFLDARVDVR